MNTKELSSGDMIEADVTELRRRFPRTQDLYREVCVVLFFRHGITPTANKLYQLVRKGSMSAPTEALSNFWKTLQERSRVTVEHADLPNELQIAAGEMVAALWKSAQTRSLDALAALREQAAKAVATAESAEAKARDAHATALEELGRTRATVHAKDELNDHLRQELAASAATNVSMEERLDDLRRQLADMQLRADQQAAAHLVDREKLDKRTRLAEQRFAEMERRALVDMDRERTISAKLQKTLEGERNMQAKSLEHLRKEQAVVQETAGELRGQLSAVENASAEISKTSHNLYYVKCAICVPVLVPAGVVR